MAQEDKALVMRGMFLLALIGGLVIFVMTIILWRDQRPPANAERAPEFDVAALVAPADDGAAPRLAWLATYAQTCETLPSAPGWQIRYNAAATLARRGSAQVPWATFREMLDENRQRRNQAVRLPDGRTMPDDGGGRAFMIIALKALAAWHEKQPSSHREAPPELRELYPIVDTLAQSKHEDLKAQAEKARELLFR
jgi:hypothetical protein